MDKQAGQACIYKVSMTTLDMIDSYISKNEVKFPLFFELYKVQDSRQNDEKNSTAWFSSKFKARKKYKLLYGTADLVFSISILVLK